MQEDKTLKVGSLDELTEHIRKNYGTTEITLIAELDILVDRNTYEAGIGQRRAYPISYSFKDADGRDVVYNVRSRDYLRKRAELSEDENLRATIRIFITANDTLASMEQEFPDIETKLCDLQEEIDDTISWAFLYDAQIHEIEPYRAGPIRM